ncbi:MAG TPA: hypothetical protein VFQ65_19695, partial [Kofleriaceae bacterium]|nr:hypothetical protein [Kofleriaceae bacterium]
EDADEIISKNPSSGAENKPKPANGKPVKPGANKDAKGKTVAKKPPAKGAGGGKTAPVVAAVAAKHEEGITDIGAFKGVSTSDLALIHQELIEHEEWKGAQNSVGGAGSTQRAAFIAEQTGKGVFGAGATGFGLGVGGALLTEGVGKGAGLALTKLGVSAAGEEIPGIGPIIAGAFSAYSLWTKNWKEAGETISAMGTGADRYEKLANTLAGIAEIIDIVVNVLNVVAGVTAAIGLVMWIVTIITLGAAAPLAITLTEIAAGVVMATLILDAIAKLVINPMVLLFRAMHTFQSDADPRSVQQQGDKLSETANQTVGFVGNMLGAKAGEAGVDKVKEITAPKPATGAAPSTTGGEQPHTPPEAKTETDPHAKPADTDPHAGKPPEAADPHAAAKPPEGDPHAQKPETEGGETPEGGETKPAGADTRTREQKLADANKKLEDARAAREKVGEDYKKSYEENRAARKEAQKAHDEATEQNEKNLHKKLDEIETARKAKVDEIEAARKAELDKLNQQTKSADERLANAERARDTQHEAATKTKDAEIAGAKSKLDGKSQAAQDKLSAAETDARAQANHGADKEFAQRDAEVEAKHAESLKHIEEIKDPAIREQHVTEEQQRYLADKQHVAADKAARAAELAKPNTDAAKAQYDRDVAAAKSEYDASVEKATDAEANANAKTDRAFTDEKAAHAQKEAQIAKATKKVNSKGDLDAKHANEGAEKDTDTANDERTEADKTAAEQLEHKNEHLDEENAEARQQRHERDEAVEKAEAERDKYQWPPWRIVKEWAIKPLWEPFSPSKNFEKGHKDIDLLGGAETRERNKKAVEEAAKKKEEAKRESELRPKDPEVEGAPPEKEGEAEKKAHEDQVAKNQKIGAIVGGGIGLFAGGIVAAPWSIPGGAQRGRDFGEGLAGKEPETREQIERKVSPKYVDPPGSEKDLADAKAQIEADMAARAQWADKKAKELAMQGKEKHNSAQLAEAQKMAKEATEASNQHKEAVAAKDASIEAQKQRATQAGQQGADGAHRLAGMTIIEVPLKAFQGFTWIGAKLGSTKFQEMNNDANNFAAKLAEMKKTVSGTQETSKAEQGAIDKDKQTNAATKAKGAQTAANMTKTETGFTTAKTRVDGAVATRGANAAAADGQAQKSDADAKNAQAKYQDMSAKLTAWAKQHQQARLAAKA